MTDTTNTSNIDHLLARARYLGADAAMTAATWLEMDEGTARSVLDDVDPMVMDGFREPNLSGEFADDPTPTSLAQEIIGTAELAAYEDDGGGIESRLADAWEEGRDEVWGDAMQAHALRVTGDIKSAVELERDLENRADALRIKSERAEHEHEASQDEDEDEDEAAADDPTGLPVLIGPPGIGGAGSADVYVAAIAPDLVPERYPLASSSTDTGSSIITAPSSSTRNLEAWWYASGRLDEQDYQASAPGRLSAQRDPMTEEKFSRQYADMRAAYERGETGSCRSMREAWRNFRDHGDVNGS